jgi:phosphohistidine phosphatase
MKKLYLLRHANAEDAIGGDIERKLSNEGRKEAGALADSISKKKIVCDIILCSSAVRARETYVHIDSALRAKAPAQYMDDLYYADISAMLNILRNLDDSCESVLIISHNPTISEVASYLTGERIHLGTGILKSLEVDIKSWQDIAASCAKLAWSLPN